MMKNPFSIHPNTHLLEQARFVASPNLDERPEGMPISLIVIHGISLPPRQFGGQGVEQLFTNQLDPSEDPYYEKIQALRVSSHVFIRRNGDCIQFVPFDKRAWHAGVSCFEGREACNDFSIGIELEGTDQTPYTASQYHSLLALIEQLLQAYPSIPPHNIRGHNEIAPGRKTDPGEYFMWQVLSAYRPYPLEKTV